jgi:uncharacterized repeat protein (TIGR01451 family)
VKKHFIIFIVVLLGVFLPSFCAFANDTFPGTTISGATGSLVGSNVAATPEIGEPLIAGTGPQKSMWYTWVAPASGTMSVSTCNVGNNNSTFDTMLGVYTGTPVNALTTITSNDDTNGCVTTVNNNYGSKVTFTAVAGTTYRFQVDGYSTTTPSGTFNLIWSLAALTVNVTDNSATEGGDTAAFTLALTSAPTANVTVTIGTSTQCTFAPASLTFTTVNWATAQTITATAINDVVVEGIHSCAPATIAAANGGYTGVTATPPTLIVNDNDVGLVVVTTDNAATETVGDAGAFTVVLSTAPTANVTVTIGMSAQCTFAPSPLTFTTINWSSPQTVVVTPIDDAIVEGAHTCSPTSIAAAGGGYAGQTATPPTINITDNDTATVSILNTTNGAEAGPVTGVMTITQTKASTVNTVITYTVSGTATAGSDFTALSGTVTVLAGALTTAITIPTLNDFIVDPNETVIVTLTAVTSGLSTTLGATLIATNTIVDDDVASFTIVKAVDKASISALSLLTYTITVANTGNIPLTAPVVTDTLSNGGALTLTSGPTLTSGDAAPLGTLNVGETWIYTATYQTTQANFNSAAAINNKATFATAEAPLLTSNTVSTTIVQISQLTVVKTPNTLGPVSASALITYTYKVTNSGNVPMSAVNVSDVHNGSGPFVGPGVETLTTDAAPTGDSTDAAINGTWDILAPGDILTFTATYSVTQQDVDTLQ